MEAYTIREYQLADTLVRYIIFDESQKVFLQLLPKQCEAEVYYPYEAYKKDGQFADHYDWFAGALCHIQLSHHSQSPYANCFKFGQSYDDLRFASQECTCDQGKTRICTVMSSQENYEVVHELEYMDGDSGFTVSCSFINQSDRVFRLEAITSVALDGLTPYGDDDHSEDLVYHTFRSGWATEGKHICQTIPELNLEKSWGGNFTNVKIGTQGSRPTCEYFPCVAVEDVKRNVLWGIQLVHNATWQIDLSRHGRDLSLSGGLGDVQYGHWFKDVAPGERFDAPKAYVTTVCGELADICDALLRMREKDIVAYGEDDMAITFNEWCTTWGHPTHEGNMKILNRIHQSKAKYFVMDAGWNNGPIGDWQYKQASFPYGLKAYTDAVRAKGRIPGIWMEFECTGEGSESYCSEYDALHLQKNGKVIVGTVNKSRKESFWDFRNPKTRELLQERVINLLKDNGFGYLKIDYNADIGIGCDGAESPGEGLRQNQQAVRDFIAEIKKQIPGIMIENCSSGGMRLEPSMMAVTGMCSFSDAHECYEFPVIAANMHYLIPPCQSQIWCVLKPEFDGDRFSFTISAGFLGRICWSGNVAELSDQQIDEIYRAESFYEEVADIIRHGKSYLYRTQDTVNYRKPQGTQAVVRYSDDGNRALVVYHCFDDPQELTIALDGSWEIEKALYPAQAFVTETLTINEKRVCCGNVLLLKKRP